jgi:hypothetical protein
MNHGLHISRNSVPGAILLTLSMAPHAGVEQGEAVACGIHPSYLRCEYRVDPLGIAYAGPLEGDDLRVEAERLADLGLSALISVGETQTSAYHQEPLRGMSD